MTKSPPVPHPAEAKALAALDALSAEKRQRLADALSRACRKRELAYAGEPQPLGLVPFVVPRRNLPVLGALARLVYRLQTRAPELYRDNAFGFADLIRLERKTQAWFDRHGARRARSWELLIRPDFGFSPDPRGGAEPVLFEFNSLMLGGISIHSEALELVENLALPALGLSTRELGLSKSPHLLSYLRRWLLRGRRRAGFERDGAVALLESLPPDGGFSELPKIARALSLAGTRALHGDPRELSERGGRVALRGAPVSFVYRDFSFEDASGPDAPRLRRFARLWEEGRVTPGFAADFDQKGILECLTSEDFAALFSRKEASLLRKHVPWTRVLGKRRTASPDGRRVDLPEFARENRETLVLKPSWSSGGDGILLGPKTSQARWEAALEKGLKTPGGWALQTYLDLPKKRVGYFRDGKILTRDCRCTLGVFYDGSGLGFHARVSPKDIVNVARGGAMSAVFFG